jgi:hypothetical protein
MPAALLAGLSIAGIAVSYWLLFRAGCTADVKGGAGDVSRALALENMALIPFVTGLGAGVTIFLWRRVDPSPNRYLHAALFLALAVPVLWMFGMQIEVSGVQHCLQP